MRLVRQLLSNLGYSMDYGIYINLTLKFKVNPNRPGFEALLTRSYQGRYYSVMRRTKTKSFILCPNINFKWKIFYMTNYKYIQLFIVSQKYIFWFLVNHLFSHFFVLTSVVKRIIQVLFNLFQDLCWFYNNFINYTNMANIYKITKQRISLVMFMNQKQWIQNSRQFNHHKIIFRICWVCVKLNNIKCSGCFIIKLNQHQLYRC